MGEHSKLVLAQIDIRDKPLPAGFTARGDFLAQLEYGRKAGFGLLAQTQSGALEVEVVNVTYSDAVRRARRPGHQEATLTFDSRVARVHSSGPRLENGAGCRTRWSALWRPASGLTTARRMTSGPTKGSSLPVYYQLQSTFVFGHFDAYQAFRRNLARFNHRG